MTKTEALKFLSKISGTYPNQFYVTEDVKEVWVDKLASYDLKDIEDKFEEHLKSELNTKPPMIHFLTRYLKTEEEKKQTSEDFKVRCSLCGREVYLSQHTDHHRRCLRIKALQKAISKAKKETITYEELDKHTDEILEKLSEKYIPIRQMKDYKPKREERL